MYGLFNNGESDYFLADILGGYVAFVVSILVIGVLTAFIGDLASHLGCSVGLKDSVTAIAFVALGTSIPGIYTCMAQKTGCFLLAVI